jgi:hypothetical protein
MLTQYKTYVLSHYIMAKVFVPPLKPAPESSFTFITGSGGGSSMVLFPRPPLSFIGIDERLVDRLLALL